MGMKSGSGDLSFDDEEEEDEEPDSSAGSPETQAEESDQDASTPEVTGGESTGSAADATEYPYFVRRSGVMDGRDIRIELHLRSIIAEQEAGYRQDLADELDVDQVSKTDAREFALKVAYENPGLVADLMREEGFDALN